MPVCTLQISCVISRVFCFRIWSVFYNTYYPFYIFYKSKYFNYRNAMHVQDFFHIFAIQKDLLWNHNFASSNISLRFIFLQYIYFIFTLYFFIFNTWHTYYTHISLCVFFPTHIHMYKNIFVAYIKFISLLQHSYMFSYAFGHMRDVLLTHNYPALMKI